MGVGGSVGAFVGRGLGNQVGAWEGFFLLA